MTSAGGYEETVAGVSEVADWLSVEREFSDDCLLLPALQVRQTADSVLYSFAVDAKLIPRFASVSRLHRGSDHGVVGYQRREVRAHVLEIKKYLESPDPLIPNAIVIAFDRRVTFEPLPLQDPESPSQWGTIAIPCPGEDAEMPGWVVDGQQRVAAMREARIDTFPILVTAFLADSESEQKQQFILVNSTKPLEKGLMYELLPSTTGQLPSALEKRRLPSTLMERLNFDVDSPFCGMIQAPTTPGGIVKDNSILRMIENSLSDGLLYRFRDPVSGESDNEAMLLILSRYWAAVARVFPEAWGLPPRRSRLMHGVGIASMGYLMDAIADRHCYTSEPTEDLFAQDLEALKPYCRWTNGYWDFGPGAQFKWNELQNTSRHIGMLANYLLVVYKSKVWSQGDRTVY